VGSEKTRNQKPKLETATEQPLWKPAQPQSEQRHLIPRDSFLLLVPQAKWEISQVGNQPRSLGFPDLVRELEWFYSQLLSDWNNWNFGTLRTCLSLKRFERSAAVERLERLERASLGYTRRSPAENGGWRAASRIS
jgi:hypothetical protein